MYIRNARIQDIPGLNKLLHQVLMVHHNGRPDLFKPGATKYSDEELVDIIQNPKTPIFVAVDENEEVLGYCFCIHQQHLNNNILTDIKTLYIDDLCVEEHLRGQHIGSQLYEYVKEYAKINGYYNITLNVWSLNDSAMHFYKKCGLLPQKVGMEEIL